MPADAKVSPQTSGSPAKTEDLIDLTDAEQLHPNLQQPLTPAQLHSAKPTSAQQGASKSAEKSAFVQDLIDLSEPAPEMTPEQRIKEMGDLKI